MLAQYAVRRFVYALLCLSLLAACSGKKPSNGSSGRVSGAMPDFLSGVWLVTDTLRDCNPFSDFPTIELIRLDTLCPGEPDYNNYYNPFYTMDCWGSVGDSAITVDCFGTPFEEILVETPCFHYYELSIRAVPDSNHWKIYFVQNYFPKDHPACDPETATCRTWVRTFERVSEYSGQCDGDSL